MALNNRHEKTKIVMNGSEKQKKYKNEKNYNILLFNLVFPSSGVNQEFFL